MEESHLLHREVTILVTTVEIPSLDFKEGIKNY
jgi:hypothetical protein